MALLCSQQLVTGALGRPCWPLPPPSLAGSQSVSSGNRGRLAILHKREAGTCLHTLLLRETEVLCLGSPLHAVRHHCRVAVATLCLRARDLGLSLRHVTGRSLRCLLSTTKANSISKQK